MRSLDVDYCGGDDDEGDSEALIGMLMSDMKRQHQSAGGYSVRSAPVWLGSAER